MSHVWPGASAQLCTGGHYGRTDGRRQSRHPMGITKGGANANASGLEEWLPSKHIKF